MKSIIKAREVLAALPRCTALSRQTGVQCKNPGLGGGGKCRFHGGASTGRPLIHGHATKQAKLDRDWVRLLLGVIHTLHGGNSSRFSKPGHLTAARGEELLKLKGVPSIGSFQQKHRISHNCPNPVVFTGFIKA